MKRRNFIRNSLLCSASVVTTSNLYVPPSQAWGGILLRLGMSVAMDYLINQGIALLFGMTQEQIQEWYDKRIDVQLAQRELIARNFTDIRAAHIPNYAYKHVLVGTRRESLGYSPALVLPDNRGKNIALAGPAAVGLLKAVEYLKTNSRMSQREIRNALVPIRQNLNEWESWQQDVAYTKYETLTSQTGVTIEYRRYGKNNDRGNGEIVVSVETAHRFSFGIEVEFA